MIPTLAVTVALFIAAWTGHLGRWLRLDRAPFAGAAIVCAGYAGIFALFLWSIDAPLSSIAVVDGLYLTAVLAVLLMTSAEGRR